MGNILRIAGSSVMAQSVRRFSSELLTKKRMKKEKKI